MRRLTFALVLAFTLTLLPYVRRGALPPRPVIVQVTGSRDRALHGKARRTARRAA